jgi:cell division septation protein DedD
MTGSREEKMRALARRRSKEPSPSPGAFPSFGGGKNTRWTLAVGGVLLIALLAYVTGVRMGMTLTEIRQSGGTGSKGESEKIAEPPFRFHAPEEASKPAQESLIPKSGSQEIAKSETEKGEAGRGGGKIGKEKPDLDSSERKAVSSLPAKYAIQVGAFNNSKDAQEMVEKLKSKGYAAYPVTGSAAAKGTWHRVRIGRFQSLQEARQFALRFEKKEKIKTIITPIAPP